MDPAAPSNDPGRGISSWQAHFDYVDKGTGVANAHELISARMVALKSCIDKPTYARLYADLSVLIARVGRDRANWKDGMDPTAPTDDPGRGISAWAKHNNHVLTGPGYGDVHRLVGNRLQALRTLAKAEYARVYADASVLLAKFARN